MPTATNCLAATRCGLSVRAQIRRSAPNLLTAAEIKALVDHLPLRVLPAAAIGLGQSELFGLKWRDVDFQRRELSAVRSIGFGVVGRCKTESSQKPVPLHLLLRE